MTIEVNKSVEVTKTQYGKLSAYHGSWGGIVAHRQEEGRYYVKLMSGQYTDYLQEFLDNEKSN